MRGFAGSLIKSLSTPNLRVYKSMLHEPKKKKKYTKTFKYSRHSEILKTVEFP